jgi:AcrR family transcriptional regulator
MKGEENMPKKIDRRVLRTRQMLRDALMELIVEKGYEAITIQDITDRANVGRTTFYLHYQYKDDLLFNGMREMYLEIIQQIEPGKMDDPADWAHVAQYADFYKVMMGSKGSQPFTVQLREFLVELAHKHVIKTLQPNKEKLRLPGGLLAHFIAGAEVGMVTWWLSNSKQYSAETMAKLAQTLTLHGLLWGMGLDSPPTDQL